MSKLYHRFFKWDIQNAALVQLYDVIFQNQGQYNQNENDEKTSYEYNCTKKTKNRVK